MKTLYVFLLTLILSSLVLAQTRQSQADQFLFRNVTTVALHDSATQPGRLLDTLKLASAQYSNINIRLRANASDTVTFISGGITGGIYVFRAVADDSVVTFLSAGRLKLAATCVLTKANDRLILFYDGTNWIEHGYVSATQKTADDATIGAKRDTNSLAGRLQDSLFVKLNRSEAHAAVQDSLMAKLNRVEATTLITAKRDTNSLSGRLQDSLYAKLNRSEAHAAVQDSMTAKLNRSEVITAVDIIAQDSLDAKLNRSEATTLLAAKRDTNSLSGRLQDSLFVKLNRGEATTLITAKRDTSSLTGRLQDSLFAKLNRGEATTLITAKRDTSSLVGRLQDSLFAKLNRGEATTLIGAKQDTSSVAGRLQDSLAAKLNRTEFAGITALGKIATYNGTTSDAFGLVMVVDSVKRTGQTADISAANFANVAAGLYEVAAYVQCTTASGSGTPTLSVTIAWTDAVGATSRAVISGFSVSATGRTYSTPNLIQLQSGNITWATAIANPDGSPQYSVFIVLKRIG